MRISEDDKKALAFIPKFKIATTNTIAELFYPSLRYAQHRLKLLYENKELKRSRDNYSTQYMYYMKKPSQIKHCLLLTEFYLELNRIAQIVYFDTEFTFFEGIRPDAFTAVEFPNKRKEVYFIEVELSNKPDVEKYEQLYLSHKWKSKGFPAFPKVVFVTNKPVTDSKYFDVIKIDEDMKDLRRAFRYEQKVINQLRSSSRNNFYR